MNVAPQDMIFAVPDERDANHPAHGERNEPGALEINVIYTTETGSRVALKAAGNLARNLNVRVNVLAVKEVPLGFPLSRPPVAISFTQQQLYELASQGMQGPLETTVQLCYCRKKLQGLLQALKPRSLVVIGGRERLWPTRESRLADALQARGHNVIMVH